MPTSRDTRIGYLLAPLAAPLAVFTGSALRALVMRRPTTDAAHPVLAALIIGLVIVAFGAPLAYAATLVVLWPTVRALRAIGHLAWWSLTGATALAGGVLFPLYLHWLEPRGSFDFFPGAGVAAGAASGFVFWWIALRQRHAPAESAGDEQQLL